MDNKVALIYRSKQNKRFSIEILFSSCDNLNYIKKYVLPVNFTSIINIFKIMFFCFKIKERIIHITGDVNYVSIFLFWKKSIITIHDLNHYENLKGIKKFLYGIIWFYLPLKFSKKIVVISPYTKIQLKKHFNFNDKKIVLIPNTFKSITKIKVNKEKEIFKVICIGSGANKNLLRLINAVENIDNVQLIIIGVQPKNIVNCLISKKINYLNKINLNREELEFYYNSADLLYFASTKEGFGLPILEAQSIGLPVLTSTTTSMPFVAGDGAIFVDPYSENDIISAVKSIINKEIDLELIINNGYQNIKRFSEDCFIDSYKKIYDEL